MFLSRLQLNPSHPQARRDLASAYEMHRTLARAFAANADAPPARFLWRLERDGGGLACSTVLVQAALGGCWDALITQTGYLTGEPSDKTVAEERLVQVGRAYRFRLLANPTVTRAGKRWGLHDEDARLAWLQRQGQRHGFALRVADRSANGRLHAMRGASDRRITLDAVLFDGVIEATDAVALRHALVAGIGPGKALGLGLLSLAPVPAPAVS